MEFLKAHYDRVLLIAGGLLLLAVTAYTALGLGSAPSEFPLPAVASQGAPFEPNPDLSRLAAEAPRLREPGKSAWGEADQGLFVSRIHLLREGQLVDILESETQLVPGIPNVWILQHKLDYTDRNLAQADPDGDGFTNAEEHAAGTNPVEEDSKPPLVSKLRVKSFEKIPFRIKFMGAPSVRLGEPYSPETEFSINTIDYSSPTQFLKAGEKIAGTELKVVAAESKKAVDAVGAEVDVSELTVKDEATGDVIVLVAGREVDSPYSYAMLVDTITGTEIRAEKGRAFEFGPEKTAYKLLDVDADAALIEPVGAEGERIKVPPLSDTAERPPNNASLEEAN
jgi:hypothetical protein